MNRDPMDSFNKPFQSGDGLCYPIYARNYYKTQTTPMYGGRKTNKSRKSQKGGNTIGDYSQPSTVNDYPGSDYLTNPSQRNALTGSGVPQPMNPLTEKFLSNNMGVTYATQAGGRRKNKKGGYGPGPYHYDDYIDMLGNISNQNNGILNRAEKQRGGFNIVAEEEMSKSSILSASAPTQGVYPILSGGKLKKYNKKGGNTGVPTMDQTLQPAMSSGMQPTSQPSMQPTMPSNMPPIISPAMPPTMPINMQQPRMQPNMQQPGMLPNMQQPNMPPTILPPMPPTMQQPTMSGGKNKKNTKKDQKSSSKTTKENKKTSNQKQYKKYNKKGGNYIFTPGANFSSQPAEIATQMDPLAQAQHTPRGGFAMKNMSGVDAQMAASDSVIDVMSGGRRKSSRKLRGGVSDFATTLSSRGPINYPDQPSADRFRYFNKTGTFIPNTQLQYAAAPISTGYEADPNPYPIAYNDYIGGAKKKAAPAKKKATPAKKKATPAKKKVAADKKKSASDKKKSTSEKKKK
jgi:hypothetical protein